MILAIVSSCPLSEIFLGMQIVTANSEYLQHKQQKGTYLLHVLPRDLSVCRMFQLPSCMLQEQSFNTGLNSATQKHKKWHANDHQ